MDDSSGGNSSGFACTPTAISATAHEIACPCCGGSLTAEQIAALRAQLAAEPASSNDLPAGTMFIDPHCHMIARTTDDYSGMEAAGIVAVIEPAFWLGQPRTNVGSYTDYLSHIIGFELFRAGQFGIRHYCTIGLNPKEANNEALAEAVMDILPSFAGKEGVVALARSATTTRRRSKTNICARKSNSQRSLICR
jgi:uncharacterized protein